VSRPNAEIAAEIYAFFDYESAAAGRLDSLFERYAVPDEWTFEPTEMEAAGDNVLVPVLLHARGRGSGLELPGEGFHVWTFRDGKAARVQTYFDEAEARRAAGLPDLQSPA
jgi:ketosteroid isomerase-like protein